VKDYFRKMSFTSLGALRALGNPTRLRILACLQVADDATATECAAQVGESASSCSYHLRTLARHGFVEQVPSADRRERRWRRLVTSIDWDAGAEKDEEYQAASALARAALLELSDETVRSYLEHERSFSAAWREAAAFLQTTLVASPAELEEVSHRIQALLAEYAPSRERPRRGARTVHVSVRAVPE
jgi:DNA-binding transcriptional ArsR family regulator